MKGDLDGLAKCMETPTLYGNIFDQHILEKIVRGIFTEDPAGGTNHFATIANPELRAIAILWWTKIEDLIDPDTKGRFVRALGWVVRGQEVIGHRFASYVRYEGHEKDQLEQWLSDSR